MSKPAHNRLDLVGHEFGILSVEALEQGRGSHGELLWLCRCACGVQIVRNTNKLRTGHTKSCGCLKRRSGAAHPGAETRSIIDRLAEWSQCDISTRCLIWNGNRRPFGHGTLSVFGRDTLVHRLAWEELRGPIAGGLDCLHNCPGGDNPACWNVDHLWLGTQGDNNADRDRKGRHVALKGEDHGCAKLTTEEVLAIRADRRLNYRIAKDYGISGGHVGDIKRRAAWSHVP